MEENSVAALAKKRLPEAQPLVTAKDLYDSVCRDVENMLTTEVATVNWIPAPLEYSNVLPMSRLWNRRIWDTHRSEYRWVRFVRGWLKSSTLKAMRLPLTVLLVWGAAVLTFNRLYYLYSGQFPLLRLPQTPLSLQAASIGLILVFRTNQTNDRLREAQKEMGRLSSVQREVLHMLLVHVSGAHAVVICLVARYLAFFGWALKMELWESDALDFAATAKKLLPSGEYEWISKRAISMRTNAILFRIRTLVGDLYESGSLDKEAFKFVEDDLAKLSDIHSVCHRLTTFPIPPAYHRHGSRSILLWIGALPFALEGKGHGAIETLFTIFITGFVILGLDAIAIESEQPCDIVPLHEFARELSKDVTSVLEAWTSMPAAVDTCVDGIVAVGDTVEGGSAEEEEKKTEVRRRIQRQCSGLE